MATNKTTTTITSLGTRWKFTDHGRNCYGIDVRGHVVGRRTKSDAFRVTLHPRLEGWTVDRLPLLTPWEEYIDGPFPTAEAAARALVAKARKVG